MPTRTPMAAPKSGRIHRVLAAALVALVVGGCAQVLGLEEWKPVACEDTEDPSLCEKPMSCSECLFAAQPTCQGPQMECTNDATTCQLMLNCSEGCSTAADTVLCFRNCCKDGNGLFDVYLTCLCDVCQDECGNLTLGCNDYCNPP